MSKRKKVEPTAWVLMSRGVADTWSFYEPTEHARDYWSRAGRKCLALYDAPPGPSPAEAAVVRAAVRYVEKEGDGDCWFLLRDAVERLKKARK